MISVCCCAINSRYEVESLFKTLQAQEVDFELCVTLDNRVNDGSLEHFETLHKQYPNFKYVVYRKEDSIEYLQKLLQYYRAHSTFPTKLQEELENNLEKYIHGTFLNSIYEILWLTSGPLYNKAVSIASGDILVITPGDFIYLFSLKELEDYVKRQSKSGRFYTSPPAIWTRISNQEYRWLQQHVSNVYHGKIKNSKYRFDSLVVLRDYLRCPEHTMDLYLPDFRHNKLIPLNTATSLSDIKRYCLETFQYKDLQSNPQFHGFHIMTRDSFDAVGGFTEVFYGRAFADDMMTKCGNGEPGPIAGPAEFSVAWCKGYLISNRGPGLPENWLSLIKKKDKLFNLKPQPGLKSHLRYLHDTLFNNQQMAIMINDIFAQQKHPIRL